MVPLLQMMETQAKIEIHSAGITAVEKSVTGLSQEVEKLKSEVKTGGSSQPKRSPSHIPIPLPLSSTLQEQELEAERAGEYQEVRLAMDNILFTCFVCYCLQRERGIRLWWMYCLFFTTLLVLQHCLDDRSYTLIRMPSVHIRLHDVLFTVLCFTRGCWNRRWSSSSSVWRSSCVWSPA
jgi:hypothetical protein